MSADSSNAVISAPDVTLPDGRMLSELQGQPVVMAFSSATWNPAQEEALRFFNELLGEVAPDAKRRANGDRSAPPVLLNLNTSDNRCDLDFANGDAEQLAWLAGLDPHGSVAQAFGVEGQNALFVLDETGVVRWHCQWPDGSAPRTGAVLEALSHLTAGQDTVQEPKASLADRTASSLALSRRTFVASTLAAAFALAAGPMLQKSGRAEAKTMASPSLTAKPMVAIQDLVPCTLRVNGKEHHLDIEPRVALLDALRENLSMTGTKKGCDHGQCGACTVHVNGERTLSCLSLALMHEGDNITTIEGLERNGTLHPVQTAFIEHDGFQCGYCTPGQIMSAVALLREGHYQTEPELREGMSGNLCRCAAYPNIIAAIQAARGTV